MSKTGQAHRARLLGIIFMMIAVTVGSAFAIVWMQQQISRTAQRSQSLERELAEKVRRLGTLDERIATEHQPVVLQGQVAGTLRPALEDQVVWVREREVNGRSTYAVVNPFEASMNLAFLERRPAR